MAPRLILPERCVSQKMAGPEFVVRRRAAPKFGGFPSKRQSRSGPPVTHRDGHAASPTPRNGAPPHAGGGHFAA